MTNILGFALVIAGGLLSLGLTFLARQGFKPVLRPLAGYAALARLVGQAVESGGRVHVSTGSGDIAGEKTAATLSGIAALDYVSEASSISDLTPLATTGDATAMPLLADTVRRAYQRTRSYDKFDPDSARLVAFEPLSMAAGITSMIPDESVRANVLLGSFGPELALITESGRRNHLTQVAGSDELEGQAVAYAMADHALIGEEIFAARAYLSGDPGSLASIALQDVLRWLIIAGLVIGTLLGVLGLIR
jgi:hypothetical protein